MKTLKNLIRIDAVLFALLGWLEAFANRNLGEAGADRARQDDLALSFLGTGWMVFAVLLFVGSDLLLVGNRRKLGRWLAGGNAFLSFSAFLHGSVKEPLDLILLLVPAGMAVALVWVSALPLKPEDAAAELAEARVPDEVRQALLRQIGESAAQEERNRLARDLHDSIKQQLFTINVGAATAQERWEKDPEGAQAALVDVRRSAREAMVEMQAMLHQLRPQALTSTTGLIEALREQAEALGYRSGAQVTVEVGPEIPDDRMPPGAQEALFRISQEALANVARHARAGTVRVWIGEEGEEAVLRVEDDGQGFDPETAVSGMGLRNLRERAAALRGRVDLESTPGAGSAVRVRIPLRAPAAPVMGTQSRQGLLGSLPFWFFCMVGVFPLTGTFHPDLSTKIFDGVLAVLFFGFAMMVRVSGTDLQRYPEPQRAYLRFAAHRNVAVLFFGGAARLSRYWMSSQGDPGEWDLAWKAGVLLCLSLSWVELAAFHRRSERRREWRLTMPPDQKALFVLLWLMLSAVFAVAILGAIRDLNLARLVMLSLMGLGGLYIVSRQPPEGASP